MITLFSAPKPFIDKHIITIQRNAIHSWLALGDEVEVILLGEEPGLIEAATELNVPVIPIESRTASGAPLIDELFALAWEAASHNVLAYLNADIILMDDFLPAVKLAQNRFTEYLIVGNRWDIEIREPLDLNDNWGIELRRLLQEFGRRHKRMGSDYFVFSKGQFHNLPEFALGRAGWDNWMMYKARHEGLPLIDASAAITAVHQDHDYSHLPGGEPHYRHPESMHNIQLAGGYETMFRLRDANWILSSQGIRKKKLREWEWPRKIEADLISTLGAGSLARLIRMVFHPKDAFLYLQQKISNPDRLGSIETGDREGAP